jgi:hypothetical protein
METPEDVEPLPQNVRELLAEDDPFRLVIRAHAEIEQLVTLALVSAFIDQTMPDWLEHVGFKRDLSLAISLGLLAPSAKDLVGPLTRLRNKLVHDRGPVTVSAARAKAVLGPFRPYLPEEIRQRLKNEPPITYLRLAAATIYLEFADGIRVAVWERAAAEEALAERKAKSVLSSEQIAELLALEEEGDGSNE